MPRKRPFAQRPQVEDENFRAFIGRIKLRMFQLGINQSDFARRLGSDHAAVSGWMLMKYMPKFDTVPLMGKALHCSLDWLLTGEGEPDPRPLTPAESIYTGYTVAIRDMEVQLERLAEEARERARVKGRPRKRR